MIRTVTSLMPRSPRTRNALATTLCATLMACSSDDSSNDGEGGSGGAAGSAGSSSAGSSTGGSMSTGGGNVGASSVDECSIEGAADTLADVTGTWAMQRLTERINPIPTFPEPIFSRIADWILVELEQDGTNVTMRGTYCARDNREDPGALADIVIPDAVPQNVDPFETTGTYEPDADGVGRLTIPRYWEVESMNLTDIENEELPTDGDDPRVFDADGDGKPGETIFINGIATGEVHSAVRNWHEYYGVAKAEDRIEGVIVFDAETVVFSTEPDSLKDLAVDDEPNPDVCLSTLTLIKIDADATCYDVVTQGDTLFPQ